MLCIRTSATHHTGCGRHLNILTQRIGSYNVCINVTHITLMRNQTPTQLRSDQLISTMMIPSLIPTSSACTTVPFPASWSLRTNLSGQSRSAFVNSVNLNYKKEHGWIRQQESTPWEYTYPRENQFLARRRRQSGCSLLTLSWKWLYRTKIKSVLRHRTWGDSLNPIGTIPELI